MRQELSNLEISYLIDEFITAEELKVGTEKRNLVNCFSRTVIIYCIPTN